MFRSFPSARRKNHSKDRNGADTKRTSFYSLVNMTENSEIEYTFSRTLFFAFG